MEQIKTLARKLDATRPFTENEAWNLFRLAAFGEAIGWTILIIGIAIKHSSLSVHAYAVPIAGRIHGTLFILYFAALLAIATSVRWSRLRFVIALLVSIPPFGTLAFEQYLAHKRRDQAARTYFRNKLLAHLTDGS
jgi:integral membrane protein